MKTNTKKIKVIKAWAGIVNNKLWKSDGWLRIFQTKKEAKRYGLSDEIVPCEITLKQ